MYESLNDIVTQYRVFFPRSDQHNILGTHDWQIICCFVLYEARTPSIKRKLILTNCVIFISVVDQIESFLSNVENQTCMKGPQYIL